MRTPRALVALLVAGASLAAHAATASPAQPAGHGMGARFEPQTPTRREHTEFVVEVNKLGQVVRATDVKRSDNAQFNAMTYGNALQAYIRRPDNTAVSGVYRLSYDYDPATKNVRRSVALIHAGGLKDPNALGAVNVEKDKLKAEYDRAVEEATNANGQLPGLHQITRHHH